MGYLLDTDVLSESSKAIPNEKVMSWLDAHDHEIYLSTISYGELVKGIELLAPGKRRKQIAAWFDRLNHWAADRLLPPSTEVMRTWGQLCAKYERKGRRLPVLDSLIAATAITHGHRLVTRNTSDHPTEITLINPWEM
ncbi:type II toxin-antitoxin system VapC family toxin [Phragmitibacter flavus]|nr:type II toxin-antitoxin system VapC family toxin [Phragmitibacter flavus]